MKRSLSSQFSISHFLLAQGCRLFPAAVERPKTSQDHDDVKARKYKHVITSYGQLELRRFFLTGGSCKLLLQPPPWVRRKGPLYVWWAEDRRSPRNAPSVSPNIHHMREGRQRTTAWFWLEEDGRTVYSLRFYDPQLTKHQAPQYGKGRGTTTKRKGTRNNKELTLHLSFFFILFQASTLHTSDPKLLKLSNSAQPETMVMRQKQTTKFDKYYWDVQRSNLGQNHRISGTDVQWCVTLTLPQFFLPNFAPAPC